MAVPYKSDFNKERAVNALDMKFLLNDEKSIRDYARTVWDLIGNPIMVEEETRFPYQRIDIPIGKKTRLTGERGRGLYPLLYNPTGKKDLRLTLTRDF
tara:strand:+ start:1430 stop:1723 length:294 start_codon:yes stop_codon:yes gene_type:complete